MNTHISICIYIQIIYICIYNDYEKEQRRYMTEFVAKK